MFKGNNKDTRTTPERWRRSGVFIVNYEHIFLSSSIVSIVNFEHVIAGWVKTIVLNSYSTLNFHPKCFAK